MAKKRLFEDIKIGDTVDYWMGKNTPISRMTVIEVLPDFATVRSNAKGKKVTLTFSRDDGRQVDPTPRRLLDPPFILPDSEDFKPRQRKRKEFPEAVARRKQFGSRKSYHAGE